MTILPHRIFLSLRQTRKILGKFTLREHIAYSTRIHRYEPSLLTKNVGLIICARSVCCTCTIYHYLIVYKILYATAMSTTSRRTGKVHSKTEPPVQLKVTVVMQDQNLMTQKHNFINICIE